MPKYTVHLTQTIFTTVKVEAPTVDEALDKYWNAPTMPGGMCYGAFGTHATVDEGEWEPRQVDDEDGKVVWEDR